MGLNWSQGLKAAGQAAGQWMQYKGQQQQMELEERRMAAQEAHRQAIIDLKETRIDLSEQQLTQQQEEAEESREHESNMWDKRLRAQSVQERNKLIIEIGKAKADAVKSLRETPQFKAIEDPQKRREQLSQVTKYYDSMEESVRSTEVGEPITLSSGAAAVDPTSLVDDEEGSDGSGGKGGKTDQKGKGNQKPRQEGKPDSMIAWSMKKLHDHLSGKGLMGDPEEVPEEKDPSGITPKEGGGYSIDVSDMASNIFSGEGDGFLSGKVREAQLNNLAKTVESGDITIEKAQSMLREKGLNKKKLMEMVRSEEISPDTYQQLYAAMADTAGGRFGGSREQDAQRPETKPDPTTADAGQQTPFDEGKSSPESGGDDKGRSADAQKMATLADVVRGNPKDAGRVKDELAKLGIVSSRQVKQRGVRMGLSNEDIELLRQVFEKA